MESKTKTTKTAAKTRTPRAKKVVSETTDANMMTADIYNAAGEKTGTIDLPENVFGLKWNADLVHQVVTSMRANERSPIAHTKTRGEVRGGGKKPWRQKGTGRARHGSSRSPIWRHGGITHGPRNDRDYSTKINRKMKTKALHTILSAKLRDGELLFIDNFGLSAPKTKTAQTILLNLAKKTSAQKIAYKKGKRALIATPAGDTNTYKSFRNIPSAAVEEARNLNPLSLVSYKYIVITSPAEVVKVLAKTK